MGKIRGDVDAIGIAGLLQVLSMARCEGVLQVSQNLSRKSIRFSPAGMRILSSGKHDHPLGEILVRSGKVTREQIGEALTDQKNTGVHLGVTLVRRKLLSKADAEAALKEQIDF